MLTAENITVRYGDRAVVDDCSFTLDEGQWLMLVGPNGAGKSTLISAIARSVPYTGNILVKGESIRSMSAARAARLIGVLSQQHHVSYAYTVEEIVSLGRYAHRKGFLSRRDDDGADCIERALQATGMDALRHQSMTALSGGEVQRAFLAQVFAQNPDILILDEPANHLDLVYQKHIFSLIHQWLQTPGRAVLSVVHDLSLAKRYGTRALLMDSGRCVAQGTADETLTPKNLQQVYHMDVYEWMRELLSQWENGAP